MRKSDKTVLTALCAGHFVNDLYSSAIFPLLPLLQVTLGLSISQGAGALAPPSLDSLVPHFGFSKVLMLASGATLLSAAFAWMLPREEKGCHVATQTEMATAAGD